MTLQEAIKSGKKYKRSCMELYYQANPVHQTYFVADILATDWEIQEEKIELSKTDIRKAYSIVADGVASGYEVHVNCMLKKLGFKDV